MANAKEELLRVLKANQTKMKCASITFGEELYGNQKQFNLRVNYSEEELTAFLESLNFEYNEGYGGQELFGIVWLDNNDWLERGEYDGSEWWEYMGLPDIPEELQQIKG